MLAFSLTGCSSAVNLYHQAEGGTIAQVQQPPPGAKLPYPNLASVPPAPKDLTPVQEEAVSERVRGTTPGVSPASPDALAGLELPTAAPPPPAIPGLNLPARPTPAPGLAPVQPVAAPATPPAPPVPVSIAFRPGSALLGSDGTNALAAVAAKRGKAQILVGGFGEATARPGDEAALKLALARAERLADGLTAAGVPANTINMVAMAPGSGGFVQLVY